MTDFYDLLEDNKNSEGHVECTFVKSKDEGIEGLWLLILPTTFTLVPVLYCPCCGKPEVELEKEE